MISFRNSGRSPLAARCIVASACSELAAGAATGTDPVHVFNEACCSKVPAVAAIRDMAVEPACHPAMAGI